MDWPGKIKSLARKLGALSPGCKEAARLQSAALDHRLTPGETFGLRCHLFLCRWCRRYGSQIRFLHATARQEGQDGHAAATAAGEGLSAEARARIKQKLQSKEK